MDLDRDELLLSRRCMPAPVVLLCVGEVEQALREDWVGPPPPGGPTQLGVPR